MTEIDFDKLQALVDLWEDQAIETRDLYSRLLPQDVPASVNTALTLLDQHSTQLRDALGMCQECGLREGHKFSCSAGERHQNKITIPFAMIVPSAEDLLSDEEA